AFLGTGPGTTCIKSRGRPALQSRSDLPLRRLRDPGRAPRDARRRQGRGHARPRRTTGEAMSASSGPMLTDARAIPEAVQWHEGMLLSPQHFQLAARRGEALAAYLIEAAAPFCWGVRRLQIDAKRLLEGVFSVDELEAILPDGLLIVHSASDDEPSLELDLKS